MSILDTLSGIFKGGPAEDDDGTNIGSGQNAFSKVLSGLAGAAAGASGNQSVLKTLKAKRRQRRNQTPKLPQIPGTTTPGSFDPNGAPQDNFTGDFGDSASDVNDPDTATFG